MIILILRRGELVEMGRMLLVSLVPVECGHALNDVYRARDLFSGSPNQEIE